MTRLIYWYGTENLEEGYSFYQANKIVSYEKGLEKGTEKVPSGIQKKLDGNKKLTKTDKQIVKGLEQIAEDSQLEASERVAWLPEWKEDWEGLEKEVEDNDDDPTYDGTMYWSDLDTGKKYGWDLNCHVGPPIAPGKKT